MTARDVLVTSVAMLVVYVTILVSVSSPAYEAALWDPGLVSNHLCGITPVNVHHLREEHEQHMYSGLYSGLMRKVGCKYKSLE